MNNADAEKADAEKADAEEKMQRHPATAITDRAFSFLEEGPLSVVLSSRWIRMSLAGEDAQTDLASLTNQIQIQHFVPSKAKRRGRGIILIILTWYLFLNREAFDLRTLMFYY